MFKKTAVNIKRRSKPIFQHDLNLPKGSKINKGKIIFKFSLYNALSKFDSLYYSLRQSVIKC